MYSTAEILSSQGVLDRAFKQGRSQVLQSTFALTEQKAVEILRVEKRRTENSFSLVEGVHQLVHILHTETNFPR